MKFSEQPERPELVSELADDWVPSCDHGVAFDEDAAKAARMAAIEVRNYWPRLHGDCPKGCGFRGIAYASFSHYLWGDW